MNTATTVLDDTDSLMALDEIAKKAIEMGEEK
jgi:hypothetical protein